MLTFLFGICALFAFATHQRAGEISYVYVSGLTYEFTIITYTYTPSPADRPTIDVSWGDGTSSTISRAQKIDMDNDISKNIYVSQHTFSASGTFAVSFEDPNRNAGIVNIPNSVDVPLYIETVVVINPFLGGNSSPQLMNPPIDNGCTNVIYYHNPGAYDPDGDSLSYSLIPCRGYNGENIPGYTLPNASNSITIDAVTGDLVWDSPTMAGEYNVAILIKEWRNGVMISSMVRDMQITIAACNNHPPVILAQDTCVLAGTRLDLLVSVQDPNSSQVTLSATGAPLYVEDSPAQFSTMTQPVPYTTHFVWQTTCNHVKKEAYNVLFKAQDNGPQVNLVSFKTIHIQVVAPKPKNLQAVPAGNTVRLAWQPDSCPNTIGYKVYRRDGSNPFEPAECETGMPDGYGYQFLGTTNAWTDTTFLDDGSVLPLYHGTEYCYRVVAFFADDAESYVSDEVCVHIANDAPLIINTDVVSTHSANGTIMVRWVRPPQIDTAAFPPIYSYNLYRKSSLSNTYVLVNSTPFSYQDTVEYLDHDLNTDSLSYTYRVNFLSNDSLVEKSDPATSIYLNINASDRALHLSWQVQQPWHNIVYDIYRYNHEQNQWDSIAQTENLFYSDKQLINGNTYCYYVRATGAYWVPDTLYPLYNRSQRKCGVPYDNQPPELPQIKITTDCNVVTYNWTFSSDSVAGDAYQYYIYYKPNYRSNFSCIDSFYRANENCYPSPCEYQITNADVIVGCFAMCVSDTNHNRTVMSDSTCFDIYQCLDYHLPNVFTPNNDGYNDKFTPEIPFHGVNKVKMYIYNRWGRKVFETTDPFINWDGKDATSHKLCSDGVYYYSCEVYINTLAGESSFPLHGSITLIQ